MRSVSNNAISQGKHGSFNAVDIRAVPDPDVYAPEDGTITFAANDGDCGNKLWLQGTTGRHTLCHFERFYVTKGQAVSKGQKLGKMGTTGKVTGRHVHWAILRNGVWVYPPTLINESFKQGVTMNNESGTELYRTVYFREPENTTVAGQWNGQPPEQALRNARGAEWQSIKARLEAYPKLEKAVSDLQTALANEKNKPPEKVVEIVDRIIEKQVEVIKTVEVVKEVPKEVKTPLHWTTVKEFIVKEVTQFLAKLREKKGQ